MAKLEFLDLTGLTEFRSQLSTELKDFMTAEDAKSIKAVSQSSDKYTLYFYKKANPANESEAAYSFKLPDPIDINGKMDKVSASTVGHLAAFTNGGQVVDSGKTTGDFATAGQGRKADSAVQKVEKSDQNGCIKVDGTDVKITGLTAAAFEPKESFELAGAAQAVKSEVMGALGTTNTNVAALAERTNTVESEIDAINAVDSGILKQAKNYTDSNITGLHIGDYAKKTYVDTAVGIKANTADVYNKTEINNKVGTLQSNIDGVKSYVGTIPEGTEAKDVITYLKEQIQIAENEATYDDTALKLSIKDNKDAITVLNGTGTGSVAKKVADEIAKVVADAPEAYDTLREISDWISSHSDSAAAMDTKIKANQTNITSLQALVGTLPEGSGANTIIDYIAEYVASALEDSDLSQYAKAADLDAAKGRISSAEQSISNINKSLAAGGDTANAIADAKKAGTDAQTAVNALSDKMGKVPEGSDTLTAYIDKQDNALQGTISTVSGTVSQVQKDIQTLSGKVTANTGNITKNTTAIGQLELDTANVQETANATKNYVGTFTSDDPAINTVVKYIDKKSADAVASAKYDDTAVKADIKSNKDAIGVINDAAGGLLAQAKQYTDEKANTALENAEKYTDELKNGEVAQNSAGIAQNANGIDALKAKVGEGYQAIPLSKIQALFASS